MTSEPSPVIEFPSFDRDAASAPHLLNVLANWCSFVLKDIITDPVDRGAVAQLLEAANWAPSYGKTEPWRFVVYSGAALQELSAAFGAAFQLGRFDCLWECRAKHASHGQCIGPCQ